MNIDLTITRLEQTYNDMLISHNTEVIKLGLQASLLQVNTMLNRGQLTIYEYEKLQQQQAAVEAHLQELIKEEFRETGQEIYT